MMFHLRLPKSKRTNYSPSTTVVLHIESRCSEPFVVNQEAQS
jgi:hypothetical protein